MHGAIYVYFGVITYMCGGEGLYYKIREPITELVVKRRDKDSLLSFKGVADVKYRAAYISMVRKVRWIDAVAEEEVITSLLRP